VYFDEQGRVVTKKFTSGRRVPEMPWQFVRRLVELWGR
jgi:hypothetical protein